MKFLQIPQPTASRHLVLLRTAGLVYGEERHGAWMYYQAIKGQALGWVIKKGLKLHCSGLKTAVKDQNEKEF